MSQDTWEERYLSVVPEKLSAAEAKVLLALIEEDPRRFVEALGELAAISEDLCG